jgi:pimeloyl-ACP methyl ester carboxylesterase
MAKQYPKINSIPVNVVADSPDARDWIYQPALIQLKPELNPPKKLRILNQGREGACTGFGLAAAINLLNTRRKNNISVSPRMLYEMARKFDEWEGEEYSGSNCRGAIQGWANMGVCEESYWAYKSSKPGALSVAAAKNARSNTIGAYYRMMPRIADFHTALNETGAIFCSAHVHKGWSRNQAKSGIIPFSEEQTGGHAFLLVGYDTKGFWIQNSWGEKWGNKGLALWSYEDWERNLIDAWVFRLALATPQINNRSYTASTKVEGDLGDYIIGPPRGEIQGHFVHVDDGRFHDSGKYFSNLVDVQETATNLTNNTKYQHLVFYAHGGLNSPKASANRIKDMYPVFKKNGVYSYHWMYDTGILEELKDLIFRRDRREEERAAGFFDYWDRLLEKVARVPGRALWREMKRGARGGFEENRAGVQILQEFAAALQPAENRPLHLVGHSTGAILHAYLLQALSKILPEFRVSSVHLMAPAASVGLYKELYRPLLKPGPFGIDRMYIYYLTDELERDDSVGPYRKSLLYFVSRSFEEGIPEKILGMEKYLKKGVKPKPNNLNLIVSKGKPAKSKSATQPVSTTHGGFDNDHHTMNFILENILGQKPEHPFLSGYMDSFKWD